MRVSVHPSCRHGERGVALLTALLLTLAVLMTSVAAARSAINGARAAGHERDRILALHAAMAALADAEHDIEGGLDPGSARAAALANATPGAFAAGCRGGTPYDGLCERAPDAGDIFAALADDQGPAVEFGTFTGALIPAGEGAFSVRAPRYLIERMPSAAGALLYRVSALGFGSIPTTQVAVQAYYRKLLAGAPAAGAGPSGPGQGQGPGTGPEAPPEPEGPGLPETAGGPGIRVGWREIGNWRETVASVGK
ncbi:pilus assembly protein [Massilia sp. BSC265]|uniref:pilus assembly protein n=1 Tax=Massilia sp. BSC265 TaxID=1549812 RepID=UPI00068E9FFF|nr:pilus assembly protein [Massilia sp. BSC265]